MYSNKETYEGIPGLRFLTTDSMLNEIDECYCIDDIDHIIKKDNGCLYRGAMDLSHCLGECQSLYNTSRDTILFLKNVHA